MSAVLAPRLAIRQSRFLLQRRSASTTSEAANTASNAATKAKEGASEYAGKAQQGLSRVTSSAGSAISSAAHSAGNAVSGIGGRTGRLISFAQSLVPPTIYYARVAGELGKIIVQGRGMQPPTMQTIQNYLTPLQNAIRNPSSLANRASSQASQAGQQAGNLAGEAASNPQSFASRLRNMDSSALTSVGVVAAETIGFFTVGEMIGRFKIVGYRGEHSHH